MGAEAKRSVRELPIACGLSDLEQRERREELSAPALLRLSED